MEWTQLIIFLLSVFGLFIWNRTEARADARHMDARIDSNRDLINAIHKETLELNRETNDLMKDFHYRLLEIERNRKSL